MNPHFYPPYHIQSKLLIISGLFLFINALALTISPAARTRSWDMSLRWSHWMGLAIWLFAIIPVHKRMVKHAPEADPYLFPLSALLAGWGLLTIWRLEPEFGARQAIWILLCFGILTAGMHFPQILDTLRMYKYIFLSGGLLLTALTFIFGTNPGGNGPHLWLGCCGVYLQPSEPLKLLLVVYLSAFLSERIPIRDRLLPLLLPSLFITGLALGILLTQRDLGTSSIFLFLYCAMVYMASGKRRVLFVSLGLLALAGLTGYFFVDIIRYRLIAWIDPWTDPSGRSYQVIQSILAVANGGFYGRGIGMGSPGLVPIAHSDFIFTSITEEFGMLGSFAMLAIYAFIGYRGFLASIRATSNFRRLLGAGITLYYCCQGILIIGGNLRVLPLTGVTLPFVSYGGSSLLTSFIGILLLIQISNEVNDEILVVSFSRPYLGMFGLIIGGLLICSFAIGWWAFIRADNLLARTDNPRRAIADRFVIRGAILDRQNKAINITTGMPGGYIRRYLVPELSSIIGYTHNIYGQAGLEASLDPYLRGLQGNPPELIWWDHVAYGQPPPGLNVRLTLDLDLQKLSDDSLGNHIGAILLINSQIGEILAMASHPIFDANKLDSIGDTLQFEPDAPLVNRTTQGLYPIKTIIPQLIPTAYFSPMANEEELVNLYDDLGFYSTPQLDLPAAPAALKGTLADLEVSPAQLISFVAALGNNGLCPTPVITNAFQTTLNGWVIFSEPEEPRLCFPPNYATRITESLRSPSNPFWEFSSSEFGKERPISYYLAGTMPDWSGTPLAIIVIIEENNPALAKIIGENFLQKTLRH